MLDELFILIQKTIMFLKISFSHMKWIGDWEWENLKRCSDR